MTRDGFVNSYVNISSIEVEDGGIYECKASNGIQSVSHSKRISVFGPPFVRSMTNTTVISGDTLRINCPVSGYPLKEISWEKSGMKLPQNHRQTVYPNGTLIIQKLEREHDEDQYRCKATNDQGLQSSRNIYIKIIVAPIISPFSGPPNLREGMRCLLTCSVIEGDAPGLRMKWLKNGKIIDSNHRNIRIVMNNEFSSTLFISSVTSSDNGNYTCIASNLASSSNHTTSLIVNGKHQPFNSLELLFYTS